MTLALFFLAIFIKNTHVAAKLGMGLMLIATAGLSGCSFAPGLAFGSNEVSQTTNSGVPLPQWIRALEPPAGGQLPQDGSGSAPNAILLPITADLIRLQHAQTIGDLSQDVKRLFGTAKPYTIGPSDVVNIVVWDHPQLSLPPATSGPATDASSIANVGNGYNVNAAGNIQFPYVGSLKLAGLTEDQARALLVTRLDKFIKNPEVTVRIQAYRSARVFVDGEVRQPGGLSLNDVPLTLPEAIARAGGFLATADRSAVSVTRGSVSTVVNLPQLTRAGINPGQILLAGGDLVQVLGRDESKVYVLGEVVKPSTVLLRNGRITLNEALGESGGISQVSGHARQVFVLRNGGVGAAQVYHLDVSTAGAYALTESFDLKAKDVVFVDPSPLVRFNRVISLLLPGAVLTNSSVDTIKK